MNLALVLVAFLLLVTAAVLLRRLHEARRSDWIRGYRFPAALLERYATLHPQLSLKQRQLVAHALRRFFVVALRARGQPVAMPSRAVGDLWQEFALRGSDYRSFCGQAYGRLLPYAPAVALGRDAARNEELRRCWWHACREEDIDPIRATRVPLLFAIDRKLDLPGGIRYSAAAAARALAHRGDGDGNPYTVEYGPADFLDTCYDGTTDGLGDGDGGGDGGGGD
jgi:hypothetical protein